MIFYKLSLLVHILSAGIQVNTSIPLPVVVQELACLT